ncbi:MAG: 4Fe-4S ferredoxin [Candidatus Sedimenticola endophacoides]|uniref:4Fe-4S ferredoxin n=1 Tax=Candidatus Sedimenticola endophacoides TaxID=2548426 RepID=A0A657Q5Z4_9GAMM|nr:MAG: 4Fe-4S ferredoxin [Candidatus Sedimenticola endophacoides]OQX35187.1 MAG: 4Fe-4S ferredoxin [Candidatus Sedimenticola endophacoides]OQX36013.1 MAG: 4Fe-4S ferredoxin [Candidatus Sedimenticola endophacoides]OQX41112.1 MAG: 4Fe-4S ferredoxin [Candidatus Sedimenticola endophacoides]OQX45496.1 MAG: 4Fe-4S ferredoxin [Candidatus Sedimenticola endophacoides]
MSQKNDQPNMKRREFLGKTIAAASVATIAPGVMLTVARAGSDEGASGATRWGMLINTAKCANGCSACVDACDKENGIDLLTKPEGQSDEMWNAQRPQWIRKVTLRDKQTGVVSNLPMMCQHCEKPPCVDVCPTTASFKRADGIVMVDRHLCIGCRYCMMACPYKARSFIHSDIAEQVVQAPRGKGCVESCNLCANRIDGGAATTACQDACAAQGHHAILFGDIKDPNSAISKALKTFESKQIRADLELNTGVRYTNV